VELLIDARRTLLGSLIDYAGLFPPASLDLERAVAEYRTSRQSSHGWMLGRFLCPTSRIEELAGVLTMTMTTGEAPWAVGAIFDEPVANAALHAAVFDRHMDPAARVTAVEVKTPVEAADGRSSDEAAAVMRPAATAAGSVAPEVQVFLEVARTPRWETGIRNAVAAVAFLRREMLISLGAKLRTGGLERSAFPTSAEVACFLTACHEAGVPFKATAGLHHPVRHHDPALDVMRHGFLNIIVAAGLVAEGAGEADVIAALDDDDATAFAAGPAGLRWRERRIGAATLRTVRHDMFPGYGSCSFAEPVADLLAMGIVE
jgi:hypothetical protein